MIKYKKINYCWYNFLYLESLFIYFCGWQFQPSVLLIFSGKLKRILIATMQNDAENLLSLILTCFLDLNSIENEKVINV